MNTNRSIKPLLTRAGAAGVGFLAAIATIGLAAPTASALPPDGPNLETVAEATPFVPVPGVFEFPVPTLPTADVVVDCDATHRVRLEVGNHTTAAFLVETRVDSALVDSTWVNPDNAHGLALDFAENDAHEVNVTTGATTLFEEAVTLDCLLAAPSYEIIQNCDTQQGHARLVNDGDDTAYMGVQYPDVMHMEIEIAPHSSKDWLLAVPVGESVAFDVVSSGVTLGSEIFEFDCPVAPPAPTPDPAPVEPPSAPVTVAETGDAEPIEVAPIEVDLSADDTTNADARQPAAESDADEELAAPVEIELAGSEQGKGLTIAMALVLIGLTVLGGIVVAATRSRQV